MAEDKSRRKKIDKFVERQLDSIHYPRHLTESLFNLAEYSRMEIHRES